MMHYYKIRIKGHRELSWADWFDQLTIIHKDNGDTVLAGDLLDQAALHGVLRKVRDLGNTLISVNLIDHSLRDDQESADKL